MKSITLALALCLAGCAKPQIIYRPIAVPAGLTHQVAKPALPDLQSATQRDVALYIIALHAALDMSNARLEAIKNWSNTWNKSKN